MDVKVLEVVAEKLYGILNSLKYQNGRTHSKVEEALLLLCNELPGTSSIRYEVQEMYNNVLEDKMSDLTLRMHESYNIDIEPNLV